MIVKYNTKTFGKWCQQNSRASRGWPLRNKYNMYITSLGVINLNYICLTYYTYM